MTDSSQLLVEAAAEGDAAAITSLLIRYVPSVRAYVRLHMGKLLRAKEQSCDLAQSVCREILENPGGYSYASEQAFRRWLFQVAKHKIIDRARYHLAGKRDAAKERPIDGESASSPSDSPVLDCYRTFCTPSQHAAEREAMEQVERAMDELPADYREIIIKARLIGMSHAEIAKEMGRTAGATRVLLLRALARLKQSLNPKGGERVESEPD